MCSGSEAGSYLRLIDVVYHSILGLRVKKKKKLERLRENLALFKEISFEKIVLGRDLSLVYMSRRGTKMCDV